MDHLLELVTFTELDDFRLLTKPVHFDHLFIKVDFDWHVVKLDFTALNSRFTLQFGYFYHCFVL